MTSYLWSIMNSGTMNIIASISSQITALKSRNHSKVCWIAAVYSLIFFLFQGNPNLMIGYFTFYSILKFSKNAKSKYANLFLIILGFSPCFLGIQFMKYYQVLALIFYFTLKNSSSKPYIICHGNPITVGKINRELDMPSLKNNDTTLSLDIFSLESHGSIKSSAPTSSLLKRSSSTVPENSDQLTILKLMPMGIIAMNTKLKLLFQNIKGKELVDLLDGENNFLKQLRNCKTNQSMQHDINKFLQLPYPRVWTKQRYFSSYDVKFSSDCTICYYNVKLIYFDTQDLLLLVVTPKDNANVEALEICNSLREITSCSLFHELLNLTNGLIGNIELLEGSISKEKFQYYELSLLFTKILKLRLMDIDDFTKISCKRFRSHLEYLNVSELLSEINGLLKQFALLKNVDFKIGTLDCHIVITDRNRLLQIIVNCLFTVIENINSGKVLLDVRSYSKQYIEFIIRIQTCDKQSVDSIFSSIQNYKSSSQLYSIRNIEGISLICTMLIAQTIGKKIQFVKEEGQYKILIKCKDGFQSFEEKESAIIESKKMSYEKIESNKAIVANSKSTKDPFEKITDISFINKLKNQKANNLNDGVMMEVPCENNSGGDKMRKYTLQTKHALTQTSCLATRKSSMAQANGVHMARALDDGHQYSAIVVDDNDVNLMVLGNLLKLFGVYSIYAKNGKECISLIQELINKERIHQIKIIFMDMQMPVMGGIECTPILNGLIGKCSVGPIPIIGVSSDNSEDDRRKFILSGIQEFASKPVSKSWVLRVLQRYSII